MNSPSGMLAGFQGTPRATALKQFVMQPSQATAKLRQGRILFQTESAGCPQPLTTALRTELGATLVISVVKHTTAKTAYFRCPLLDQRMQGKNRSVKPSSFPLCPGHRPGPTLVRQWRGTQRYLAIQLTDEDALTRSIITLASEYGPYGYRRITALLRMAGRHVGKDRWSASGAGRAESGSQTKAPETAVVE